MIKQINISYCHVCKAPSMYQCTDCMVKLCQACASTHECKKEPVKNVEVDNFVESKPFNPETVKPFVTTPKRKR